MNPLFFITCFAIGGAVYHIGSYRTPQDAAAAYDAAAIKYFGEFASLNGFAPERERAA